MIFFLTVFKNPIISFFIPEKKPVPNLAYAALIKQIEDAKPVYSNSFPNNPRKFSEKTFPAKNNGEKNFFTVEINSAAAEDFERLHGIGKVLAARIIKYRTSLGGFSSIDQVRNVYGIKEEVFLQIRPQLKLNAAKKSKVNIDKVNINEADYETLSKIPNITPTLAKQFIGYRTKVKPFENLEEVKKLYYIRDHPELYEKLSPYITVN